MIDNTLPTDLESQAFIVDGDETRFHSRTVASCQAHRRETIFRHMPLFCLETHLLLRIDW